MSEGETVGKRKSCFCAPGGCPAVSVHTGRGTSVLYRGGHRNGHERDLPHPDGGIFREHLHGPVAYYRISAGAGHGDPHVQLPEAAVPSERAFCGRESPVPYRDGAGWPGRELSSAPVGTAAPGGGYRHWPASDVQSGAGTGAAGQNRHHDGGRHAGVRPGSGGGAFSGRVHHRPFRLADDLCRPGARAAVFPGGGDLCHPPVFGLGAPAF